MGDKHNGRPEGAAEGDSAWADCTSSSGGQSTLVDCAASIALADLQRPEDLRRWVVTRSDGTFLPLREFLPGAVDATIMLVRDGEGDVVDAIAWAVDNPDDWWTYSGTLEYVGEAELRRAWLEDDPVHVVSRPADYFRAHGAALCIVRWPTPEQPSWPDIDDILGPACGAVCDTPALANRLRRTMLEQCSERRRIFEAAVWQFPVAIARGRAEA